MMTSIVFTTMTMLENETTTARFARNTQSESNVDKNTGFHSNLVRGVTTDGKEYLIKRYGEKAGGYEPDHALSIVDHMDNFRRLATEINVPVAHPLAFDIEDHKAPGRVTLLEFVPFVGRDLRTVFSDPAISDETTLQYTRDYLSVFKSVQKNGYPISLDPPPANFCINENPRNTDSPLIYIDMMPPRYKIDGKIMVSEWPEPPEESKDFIHKRYFGPEQSRVIYAQLLRALDGRPFSTDQIKTLMREELGEEAYKMISLSEEDKKAALKDPLAFGPDVLRIIAAEGYHNGFYTREQFFKAYNATHIHIGGILPSLDEIQEAVFELENGRYTYEPMFASKV